MEWSGSEMLKKLLCASQSISEPLRNRLADWAWLAKVVGSWETLKTRGKRRLWLESLESRYAMIAEGALLSVDQVISSAGLLGSISGTVNWGDGSQTPVTVESTPATGSLKARIDYSLDSTGFFNAGERRAALQAAADFVFSRFSDSLSAIVPSGADTWKATFFSPVTGLQVTVDNPVVAANEIVIYAGARNLGTGTAGLGGPGGFGAFGSVDWLNNVRTRGQSGASASPATDIGPWGGSITFNPNLNWYFGTDLSGIQTNQYDFLTVATHELMHLAGFGTAASWTALVTGNSFNGLQSKANNAGQSVPLSSDRAHWAENTSSDGQEALMDPSIDNTGIRKLPTTLDFAGLDDIGWTFASQQTRITASKHYADDGNFPVQVTLVGSKAGSINLSLSNSIVTNVAPTIEQVSNTSIQVGSVLSVIDLGKFTDPGFGASEKFTFSIDWGDGTAPDSGNATIDSPGSAGVTTSGSFNGSHTFTQTGNFTVKYRITDDNGGSAEKSFQVQVTAPTQLALSLDKSTVDENAGTNAAILTIKLSGAAAGQPASINLTSSNPGKATIASSVVIPAGSTSINVLISVLDNSFLDGDKTVSFNATLGSINAVAPANITILDKESITLTLNVSTIREDGGVGATVLRVTRNNTDIGDPLSVNLNSNRPSKASLPASTIIPSGQSFVDVPVTAVDNNLLDGSVNVVLSASTPIAAYTANQVTIEVSDFEPIQFAGSPITITESANAAQTNVTLSIPVAAPATGIAVNLSSLPAQQLVFPSQVTIPAGQTSVTFVVKAVDDTLFESPINVSLSASATGYTPSSFQITIEDGDISPWTNTLNSFDIDGNSFIDLNDALNLINFTFRNGSGVLPLTANPSGLFADVNGDGSCTSIDILLVINFLFRNGPTAV